MSPTTWTIASLLLRGTRWFTVWLTGVQLLVIIVAAIVNANVNDPIEFSVWQWPAVFWIRYPLTGVGAMVSTVSLPVLLANGVTRHQYLRGAGLFAVALCAIVSAVSVVGYIAERLVYAVGGYEIDLLDQSPLRLGTVYVLLLGAYLVSGVLIGAALMRWSPWRAPLMITLFVTPLVIAELLLGTFWGGVEEQWVGDVIPLAIAGPTVMAVIAVAAAVAFVILRDVAIRPKKG